MVAPAPPVLAEYERILAAEGLAESYPPEVAAEVARLVADPGIDDPRLEDLSGLPFITIDNEDSRDLDQALQIERGPGGDGFIVRYALADASHYVRPGGALFAEALRRGTSYYLPGRVVPMLPPELSEGIVSLLPRVARRALVFVMQLDEAGDAQGTTLLRARIRSQAQLTYDGVQRYHDAPAGHRLAGQPFTETLDLLRAVGERRQAEARRRNVVEYDREEIVVDLVDGATDAAGWVARRQPRNDVSRWNEQISLLCNIEGGRFLMERGGGAPQLQPVYRVHEPPDPRELAHLERLIRALLARRGLDGDLAWQRAPRAGRPGEPLADYLDRLRASALGERVVAAIERQAMIINRSASYATQPGVHYALGVRPYSRFSAPMREVVGIFTHKEAIEELDPAAGVGRRTEDETLREAVILSANRARDRGNRIGKEVLRLAIDTLLRAEHALPESRRPSYPGTVLGFGPGRAYVQLDDPPLELKVYGEDLEAALGGPPALLDEGASLASDPDGTVLTLGDRVQLRCHGLEPDPGRWRFALDVLPTG